MATEYVELTTYLVETALPPEQGQRFIRDTLQPGFGLRITERGVRSFVVEAWVNGRSRRITLGKFPALSLKDARKLAKREVGKFATGFDVVAERRAEQARAITLQEALDDYLQGRDLKPGTVADYRMRFRLYLGDWADKPIVAITRDMVERRHQSISERSPAGANLAMRILRALMNYAAGKYEDAEGKPILTDNPIKRLSATRTWNRIERRRTVIKPYQLKPWFEAVLSLQERTGNSRVHVIRDYLLFLLFTGLRRREAARLRWDDVNLDAHTFTVPDTKNREPHTLPLSDFLHELLTRRRVAADDSPYVFPGEGCTGHIVEPRKPMARVTEASGVEFTLHDLRRTFITVAESLDIPGYALKRLLNHKGGADVTAGYIVIDVERLRAPMQKITNFILKAAGVNHEGGCAREATQ